VTAARARVLHARLQTHSSAYVAEASLSEIQSALAELESTNDDVALAEAYQTLAYLLFFEGRNGESRDAASRSVDHAQRAGDVQLEVRALETLGSAYSWSRTPWDEVERFTRGLLEDERLGPRAHARALAGLGRCVGMRREFAEARSIFLEARRLLEELGLTLIIGAHAMTEAYIEWQAGDWEAMERDARDSWDRLGELGEAAYRSTSGVILAEALVRLDRIEEARAMLDEAEALGSADDYVTVYLGSGVRGLLASRAGEHEPAIELVRRAVEVTDATDAPDHQIAARVYAAEAYAGAGMTDDAERSVAEAVELAERKGSLALADVARAVLADRLPQQ
jgi:tetratricopeptide (TPR) repeat protein